MDQPQPTQAQPLPRPRLRSATALLAVALTAVLVAVSPTPAAAADPGTISTVAGTGTGGFSGDGGPATNAKLYSPGGVAVDGAGNLYIADRANHRVRRVSSAGTITTVAGTGAIGLSGDGGPATNAKLYSPGGVAVDGAGNLFIADTYNHRVRKVSTAGTITTVAGTGVGFSGDGGPATSAKLHDPLDVAVDGAGNLYIADSLNHRMRRVSTAGTITTVAGNGTGGFSGDGGPATGAQLNQPYAVAVDGADNRYIGDYSNHRVRRVGPTGTITTVAGNGSPGFSGDGGPATNARLAFPTGVAVDGEGSLYVADLANQRVRRVSASGTITTAAGNGTTGFSGDGGPATGAQLNLPFGVTVDDGGDLYLSDQQNDRVRRVEGPSLTGNQKFTEAAYADFLGRPPSPAELAYVAGGLDSGAFPRGQVVSSLSSSPEWVENLVIRFYLQTLGRFGEPAGRAFWVNEIRSGRRSVANVAASFYASDEYFTGIGGGTNSSWVTDLYGKLLGRSPDSAGHAYWVNQTVTTGRTSVALRFYQSLESRRARVSDLYLALLGRLPDAAGRDYWAGRIETEGDLALAANLAASDEYFNRAQIRF